MFEDIIDFIQKTYKTKNFIPLHEPKFFGNEKKYLNECIDSTFVSSVGKYVGIFEKKIAVSVLVVFSNQPSYGQLRCSQNSMSSSFAQLHATFCE